MHDASHWCKGVAISQWTKNKGAGLILTVKGHVKLQLQLNSQSEKLHILISEQRDKNDTSSCVHFNGL
jgi:hypothetical protein